MPEIKVKEFDWNREGTFIKTLIEFIRRGRKDETIIKLVEHLKAEDYTEEENLSDADIFLLYCKLLEAKRPAIIKELRLIEDLVDFSNEYTYQIKDTPLANYAINFSLLAYCILNKIDWKEIAYIQQHRKINHIAGVKIQLQENAWNASSLESTFKRDFVDAYKPYLMLGDAYVAFVSKQDSWPNKIRTTYASYPQQVTDYLGFMAEHFSLALHSDASSEVKNWLENYSKALRNMTEEIISSIKNKRSLTQDEKRQEIYSISRAILDHLDAFDDKSFKILDEKPSKKLKDFIETLRNYVNKVSPVAAYANQQFFTPGTLTQTKNNNTTPTEEACFFNN